jgi:DDE superfamily endonuclease
LSRIVAIPLTDSIIALVLQELRSGREDTRRRPPHVTSRPSRGPGAAGRRRPTPEAVRGCQDRLAAFLRRDLPCFYRAEQRANAALVGRGPLSGLQRKTCEPIAVEAGVHRKPIQFLVGAGKWDDDAVMAEVRRHVREELADDRAVIVLDATTFPKSGDDSCGVARQFR